MIVKVRVKLVFGWKLKVIHNYNDSHISRAHTPIYTKSSYLGLLTNTNQGI